MAVLSTGMGTWEYVPESGYLNWSTECRNIYGIPDEFTVDFDFFTRSIYRDDKSNTLRAIQEALNPDSGGKYDINFRILRYGSDEVRWIRSQGQAFFNEYGKPERFIGTVLDITDHVLSNAALEEQIKERTAELEKLNQRLLTSNRELEQFAYVASHDLQEPLRKINAFGDMLNIKLGNSVNTDGLDLIKRMQSASSRMKSLIDSLLSFSLLSSDSVKTEIVDLDKTIVEVFEDIETSLKAKEGKIITSHLSPVFGDYLQLKQLFQNLISNSLKFSKSDIPPEITFTEL
jgi:signal transduction histidine kinase